MGSTTGQPQFRYTEPPPKVLHLSNLPRECMGEELQELGKSFRKTVNAFVEFRDGAKRPMIVCWRNSARIVGAGPFGLAMVACLREQGVSCVILEKEDCLVSLWQQRTYNRLKLHLPKQFCELPLMPFLDQFPTYPTKEQFIEYIELLEHDDLESSGLKSVPAGFSGVFM